MISSALPDLRRLDLIGPPSVSVFLGGAIATHVQGGEHSGASAPASFMSLCWLGAWLRHPGGAVDPESLSATDKVSSHRTFERSKKLVREIRDES